VIKVKEKKKLLFYSEIKEKKKLKRLVKIKIEMD